MIVEKIEAYLHAGTRDVREALLLSAGQKCASIVRRQFMADREAKAFRLQPSNVGKCPRALSFFAHGHVRSAFPPRTRIKFFVGDICEEAFLILAELAGATIDNSQLEVQTDVGRGYIDGTHTDEGGVVHLIEVKSMTDRAFSRFEHEGLDDTWGYVAQVNTYLRALDLADAVALALNTNTGHIAEARVQRQDDVFLPRLEIARRAVATSPDCVARPEWAEETLKHMPRKHCYEICDPRCRYCDCVEACWPGVQTEILSKGPVYRVPEGAING